MTKENIHLYGAIEKFDAAADGSLMVSGIASTEAVDADGEIVTADAMRKALPSYLQCGTVREMHQPIAAGNPISAHVDDDGRTHFTAHIVDKGTISKIQAKVLKGFSIGGKAIEKVGNKITSILLKDISVVDLPNNPESFFTVIKFEKPAEKKKCDDCGKMDCKCDEKKSKKENDSMKKMLTTILGLAETASEDEISKALGTRLLPIQKKEDAKPTIETILEKLDKLEKAAPARSAAAASLLVKMDDGTESFMSGTDIVKALSAATKALTDAKTATVSAERKSIIQKMDSEGRVAFDETGVAFKRDELEKMDLPMLKFAARNSAIVPMVAKAIYKGDANPNAHLTKMDKTGKVVPLAGTELVSKSWESDYGDLEKMLQTPIGKTN